jgi:hypothetical protein
MIPALTLKYFALSQEVPSSGQREWTNIVVSSEALAALDLIIGEILACEKRLVEVYNFNLVTFIESKGAAIAVGSDTADFAMANDANTPRQTSSQWQPNAAKNTTSLVGGSLQDKPVCLVWGTDATGDSYIIFLGLGRHIISLYELLLLVIVRPNACYAKSIIFFCES